jgi:hypothetical protein
MKTKPESIDMHSNRMPDRRHAQAAQRQSILRQQWQNALQETLGAGFHSHNIELTIKGWCADCTQ